MSIPDEFMARYEREYDYYEEAARICAMKCEKSLESSGLRAIVSFRAKRPDRLRTKLNKRNSDKNYASVDEIYDDIVDLSGVRIALYFPGDQSEVHKLIDTLFVIDKAKDFPVKSDARLPYTKRFSGYSATHYRVRLKEEDLTTDQKRYGHAQIEIQVASVLMHAWAEVEHDLAYKPLSGQLSTDEFAILDELNGLVLSGEIALERLQRAVKLRVSEQTASFRNHYELSAFLYDTVKRYLPDSSHEPVMGRADVLLRFLHVAGLDCPSNLTEYISELDGDTEKRPIAEQLIDRILSSRPDLYEKYHQVRLEVGDRNPYSSSEERINHQDEDVALGFFMSRWIAYEKVLQELRSHGLIKNWRPSSLVPLLERLNWKLPNDALYQLEIMRRMRNELVHGVEAPDKSYLIRNGMILDSILRQMVETSPDSIRNIIEGALNSLSAPPDLEMDIN